MCISERRLISLGTITIRALWRSAAALNRYCGKFSVPPPIISEFRRQNRGIASPVLSEGQRKANFEEYDARKRENAQRISDLKRRVKELYVRYAEAKNVRSRLRDRK